MVLIANGEICSGCSYGNACLITPSHAVPLPAPGVIKQALKWMLKEDSPLLIRPRLDPPLFTWLLRFAQHCRVEPMMRGIPVLRDLCRASMVLYEELVRTENLEFHFERRGTLYVNSTDAGFDKAKREADLLVRHGFEVKVLTGREAHEMEPAVVKTVRGAIYYPRTAMAIPTFSSPASHSSCQDSASLSTPALLCLGCSSMARMRSVLQQIREYSKPNTSSLPPVLGLQN